MFALSFITYAVVVCAIAAFVVSGIRVLSTAERISYRNPARRVKRQNGFSAMLSKIHFPAVMSFGKTREDSTLRSANGAGSTFTVYACGNRPAIKRFKGVPRSFRTREAANGEKAAPASSSGQSYMRLIGEYVQRVPLLLRDLEFQLSAAGEHQAASTEQEAPENPLEPYAVTMHGIKLASFQILAFKAGKKAEELENAAIHGDRGYIQHKTGVFVRYMDLFIDELKQYLRRP